jgi:hypothetical protein
MEEFSWNIRATAQGRESTSVYARKHSFQAGAPLAFDSEYDQVTSLEYLLGSLGSDIVGGIQKSAHRRRVPVHNVEALISGRLNNPLTYLGVVGEEGHPGLERVTITVYVSSDASEGDLSQVWEEALERSPLVSTLKKAVSIDMAMKVVV